MLREVSTHEEGHGRRRASPRGESRSPELRHEDRHRGAEKGPDVQAERRHRCGDEGRSVVDCPGPPASILTLPRFTSMQALFDDLHADD